VLGVTDLRFTVQAMAPNVFRQFVKPP
jgi:hypothetical protein